MKFLAILFFLCMCLMPEFAHASGISQFSTPLEQVVGTITGPVGKWVSIIACALCGIYLIYNKDDISGGVKLLLTVAFAITFIASAAGIVTSLFTFSGAVI